jgi:hypothetical protein
MVEVSPGALGQVIDLQEPISHFPRVEQEVFI